MLYEFFRWIHIFSYLIWLCAFGGSLVYGIRIYLAEDLSDLNNLIHIERLVTKWGHILGVGGIIVSGWVLSVISQGPQWGWFNIQLYPWLTLKQLLFLIILILITIDLRRSKILAQWMQANKNNQVSIVKKWRGAYRFSFTVYLLVVISTLLGWFKPGLTTFG